MRQDRFSFPSRAALQLNLVAVIAATLLGLVALSSAQSTIIPPQRQPGTAIHPERRVRQEPCWQVAGISQSAIRERRSLQQQARSEVQSVCADSSLNGQQRAARIRQIHQQTQQRVQALISPSQQEALRECNQARGHGVSHGGGRTPGGGGPCGSLTSGPHHAPPSSFDEEEEPQ
jgi:hypothetical protein